MMLLELERVGQRYGGGPGVALEDVSLTVEPGEMVVILGERRSGRSTLLRIAAGVEPPGAGIVRFAGCDLASRGGARLGGGISYCRRAFRPAAGRVVMDHLLGVQYARRVPRPTAERRAWETLERVGADRYAQLKASELDPEETMRVALARALTSSPRLIVVDEPTIGMDSIGRDAILTLLRSLADEGIAILASAGESTALLGADRVLALSKGRLRGELTPELATVEDLAQRRRARG